MHKYIERMKEEEKELIGRIKRVENALENPPFGADSTGLHLLEKQCDAMKVYLDILQQRIKYEVKK